MSGLGMRWGAPYFRWRRAGPVRRQSAASHDRPARTGATWPAYRGAAVVVAGVADGEDVDQAVVAGRGRERVDFRHAAPSIRGEEACGKPALAVFQKCFNGAFTQLAAHRW